MTPEREQIEKLADNARHTHAIAVAPWFSYGIHNVEAGVLYRF